MKFKDKEHSHPEIFSQVYKSEISHSQVHNDIFLGTRVKSHTHSKSKKGSMIYIRNIQYLLAEVRIYIINTALISLLAISFNI